MITVADQYRPATITVFKNQSSVEISEFPDNGTSVVANREYTITVMAKSATKPSDPSDPVVVSKFSCSYVCTQYSHFLSSYSIYTYCTPHLL